MLWKLILDATKFQQTFQLTVRLYLYLGSFLPPCNMYWFTFKPTLAQETQTNAQHVFNVHFKAPNICTYEPTSLLSQCKRCAHMNLLHAAVLCQYEFQLIHPKTTVYILFTWGEYLRNANQAQRAEISSA